MPRKKRPKLVEDKNSTIENTWKSIPLDEAKARLLQKLEQEGKLRYD